MKTSYEETKAEKDNWLGCDNTGDNVLLNSEIGNNAGFCIIEAGSSNTCYAMILL